MESQERAVSPKKRMEDHLEPNFRPRYMVEIINQERVTENLLILIEAAKARGEALDHVLFYGPPGLGKTTLAHVLANEMDVAIKATSGPAPPRLYWRSSRVTRRRARRAPAGR